MSWVWLWFQLYCCLVCLSQAPIDGQKTKLPIYGHCLEPSPGSCLTSHVVTSLTQFKARNIGSTMCRKRSSTGFWQILPTLSALLTLTTAAHLTLRPTQGFWVCFMGSVCYRFGVMCSKSTTSFEIPLVYFRIQKNILLWD